MKKPAVIFGLLIGILSFSCKDPKPSLDIPEPKRQAYTNDSLDLTADAYYDKVLGALVGSAIGDAMGVSTEMWHRNDIRRKYGYITDIPDGIRNQSPEGPWEHNLPKGATTDDTRWKLLMVGYFNQHPNNLKGSHFVKYIADYYSSVASHLADKEILASPDSLDSRLEKVDWIKEWARVAMAYQQTPQAYMEARNRFYGGEMSCAGMLYTPMFGLVTSSPEEAYTLAYDHTVFDLGYAKDIAALLAGMTHMALRTNDMDSILNAATVIDPLRYQDSRLVGRISNAISETSRRTVWTAREIEVPDSVDVKDSLGLIIPPEFQGSPTDWAQQEFAYDILDRDKRAIAFHAGEIWQILITGMEFGQGDFEKTLQFIINYGRDNDTVGAVAGMILGAKDGYSNLPVDLRMEVLETNRELLGIDLEEMARKMTGLQP